MWCTCFVVAPITIPDVPATTFPGLPACYIKYVYQLVTFILLSVTWPGCFCSLLSSVSALQYMPRVSLNYLPEWCIVVHSCTYQVLHVSCLHAGTFVSFLRVPPPEVIQQVGSTLSVVCQASSTDSNLEIQWYQITAAGKKLPVKSSSGDVQGLLFKTKSSVSLKAHILTIVTSTLTIERLSVAYAGAYACRAVAGGVKADSDAFQVQVSGMTATHIQQPCMLYI